MKTQPRHSILSLLVLASSLAAFSAGASEEKPCKEIKAACEAGGFVKGGHKENGKGLYKDCLKKILAGETVAGVSVAPEVVSACKSKKEKRGSAKAEKPAAS